MAAVGLIAFAAGIVFGAQASVAAGAPRGGWAVRVLPPVGGESCSGVGIDDSGTVVGSCRGGLGPDSAVRWRNGKGVKLAPGRDSFAAAVNARGQIAGYAGNAVLWDRGRMRNLGTFGEQYSKPTAMNERGDVIGVAWTDSPRHERVFLWRGGRPQTLPAVPTTDPGPEAINDRGDVVAGSIPITGRTGAFLWRDGRWRTLAPGQTGWSPVTINNRGEIVGNHHFVSDYTRGYAFLWRNGRLTRLPTLGGAESQVYDINERGQAVGWCETKSHARHACLWQNDRVLDLGTGGGKSSEALAIHDSGRVAGSFLTRSGRRQAFVWEHERVTALPTPHGWADAGAGTFNRRGDIILGSASTPPAPDAGGPGDTSVVTWTQR